MDRLRYAQYGGFRRNEKMPFKAQFGYGGAGYGGYGRYGKYGGWRSYYNYGPCDENGQGGVCTQKMVWDIPQDRESVNMKYNNEVPTLILGTSLLIIVILGFWYGKRRTQYFDF